ncbi:Oidioi.mRNA.OKI2018_I69.chr2.g5142.t1.cds [Oikopleura dioica]|uniref:Oidioi.mRNA.OKI2018_I69.chr2.g5142.t1.cds n=1 Tax=Oikopleura dioica TaxID=34765 RepID=A0ABN7SZL9_OIKDI|nr:Oidioi.mRNA.OKI2018_I69.chr2.g5142.t1.cds [Oikopleura dioica]
MNEEGSRFWAIWGVLMAIVIVIILCFCYFNREDPNATTDGRSSGHSSRRHRPPYTATANYPGPPEDEGRQLGPTSLPSYKRTMRRWLNSGTRTPPPEYKNISQGIPNNMNNSGPPFLESMRSVITDSFMSWYSKDDDEEKNLKDVGASWLESTTEKLEEIREE